MVDARLRDGTRVNAIIPPLALNGPTLTIRRFRARPFELEDLIRHGTLSEAMGTFLKACVIAKLNILVSGGTGSGKTTTLNVLASFIPPNERIITVEDAAELQFYRTHPHVLRQEARPPNVEGTGEITIRQLVRNALRMRPNRIVVGEVRGAEALDMLQAMNTGHEGSLTTVHANTPHDAFNRLETMVMYGGVQLPSAAIRDQMASAIHIVSHAVRGATADENACRMRSPEGDLAAARPFAPNSIRVIFRTGCGRRRATWRRHAPSPRIRFGLFSGQPGDWDRRLVWAGHPAGIRTGEELLGLQAIIGGGGVLLLALIATDLTGVAIMLGGGLLGLFFPLIWVDARATERQRLVNQAVPDALDVLTICVQAGLALTAKPLQTKQGPDHDHSEAWTYPRATPRGRAAPSRGRRGRRRGGRGDRHVHPAADDGDDHLAVYDHRPSDGGGGRCRTAGRTVGRRAPPMPARARSFGDPPEPLHAARLRVVRW